MDRLRPIARRLGVLHGRIVGIDEELDGVDADSVVDLKGAPILPGFHDAHYHSSLTGKRLAALDLRPDVAPSLDHLYSAVRAYAAGLAPGDWLVAAGYDQNLIGGHPTAEGLDRVAGGRPVVLEHVSGHMIVANTAAFERAGYAGGLGVPDFAGGFVARTAGGRAEGLLQERAADFIHDLVWPPSAERMRHYLELASKQAVGYGLTSLTEPGGFASFSSFQDASERRVFRPRMSLMPLVSQLHELHEFSDGEGWWGIDLGLRTGFGDDKLRLGPVKIMSDGSLIGKSAAMHDCYQGEPGNTGIMRMDPQELTQLIVGAHRAGWTVATHAIGDAAIDYVLDGVEEAQRVAPRANVRHRIEHFAVASDAQIARAVSLGVIGVPQGRFISEFGDGMMAALGAGRSDRCYRMKSLLNAGMVLTGSTDSPIADGSPLRSIHDMVNRLTSSGEVLAPAERVTVEEAVRAYTYGSSYAVNEETNKGTIATGMLADFILLSDDLFSVDVTRIRDVAIGATVIGGDVVHNEGVLAD